MTRHAIANRKIGRRSLLTGIGTALAVRAAWAQTKRPLIGFLSNGPESFSRTSITPFYDGLRDYGYVQDQNYEVLYRGADGREDRLPALAADLVDHRVDAIFVIPNVGFARLAMQATATIPIVFAAGGDPIAGGLMSSLDHPGGNVTGATFLTIELVGKRLEILREIAPEANSFGYLINPNNPQLSSERQELEAAAGKFGVRLEIAEARNAADIEVAVAALAQRKVAGLIPAADTLFTTQLAQLAALEARFRLPTISISSSFVTLGGMLSYGGDALEAFRIAGTYVGRILKGEKAGDLPVQRSTKVALALNLKTAKSLGVNVPLSLLGRADTVIE